MVKMMSYKQKTFKNKKHIFWGGAGQGNQKASFREFSGVKIKNFYVPEEIDFLSRKFGISAENRYQR